MSTNHTPVRNACLVALHRSAEPLQQARESLSELADLAKTLHISVRDTFLQSRETPDVRTYIGSGKLDEIGAALAEQEVDVVIFDNELSPRQGQTLESALGCMVWDRTQLILELFAQHARTAEARAQVQLAQLTYMLPRLVGLWAHLDRERGGIGASRGMGEKQITIDRQIIRKRIAKLEKTLRAIAGQSGTRKKQRRNCYQVCLIGYTNAGKSTLMNRLTGSEVLAADKLFATLDSTTRRLKMRHRPDILISDTVGFIRNLPHGLVASFRSTLDVIRDADLLLQVVDVSHPNFPEHLRTTEEVLREIGAEAVPRLLIFNKADAYHDTIGRIILEKKYPEALLLSALQPRAKRLVTSAVTAFFREQFVSRTIKLPYSKSGCLADLYENSIVDTIHYREDGLYVDCSMNRAGKKRLAGLV